MRSPTYYYNQKNVLPDVLDNYFQHTKLVVEILDELNPNYNPVLLIVVVHLLGYWEHV
jgi:hypothetical protein